MHARTVHSLLLAAGEARRYGSPKQLQTIDGISLVRRAAQAALAAGLQVSVVTGAQAEAVHAELYGLPLQVIHNAQWAQGMGSSLACGMQALLANDDAISAVLIQLADQPLVDADDLRALLRAHALHPQAIIAADHGETLGAPCLFPPAYFAELGMSSGDRGARGLLQTHRQQVKSVAMPNAAFDIDTPEDFARIELRWVASRLAPTDGPL